MRSPDPNAKRLNTFPSLDVFDHIDYEIQEVIDGAVEILPERAAATFVLAAVGTDLSTDALDVWRQVKAAYGLYRPDDAWKMSFDSAGSSIGKGARTVISTIEANPANLFLERLAKYLDSVHR